MSLFGSRSNSVDSRSNSVDSIINEFRLSDDKYSIDTSNNSANPSHKIQVNIKRIRELSIMSPSVSSSPTPENFVRKMSLQYGEYIVKKKHIKK